MPFPHRRWSEGRLSPAPAGARLEQLAGDLFAPGCADLFGETRALLLVHRGELVLERYGDTVDPEATQRSWSMAKSITHALIGLLVGDGVLAIDAPAPVPAWRSPGDARGAITLDHLLRMVDGLDFVEEDRAHGRIDVVEMIGGAGMKDTATFAEARPLAHPPGTVFNYSSGTSIVVAAIAGRAVGGGHAGMEAFLRRRLFAPLGMDSARPRFDAAGTFLGSSYVYATARDFARFGLLYLRDGVWEGQRLLPAGWVDHARRPTAPSAGIYGAHWWLDVGGAGSFCAKGYQGQYVVVVPGRDLVLVRLGVSSEAQRVNVVATLGEIQSCFPISQEDSR